MSSKILVADDSLTIQKVINITLANSGFELTECLNDADLRNKLNSSSFDLVLLDFNLSESQSGYDLSLEIKKTNPHTAIIVMLGTFDTVDESKFGEYGIDDKIVKPFESAKFIKKCKDILLNKTEFTPTEIKHVDVVLNEKFEDDLDQWKVDAPKAESIILEEDKSWIDDASSSKLDPLNSEIQGWGFSATNLEEKFQKKFPPVISEPKSEEFIEKLQSSSGFVSEIDETKDEDATDPDFQVPLDLNRDLLAEINEEVSADTFWAVDEVVPVKSVDVEEISDTHLDEVTADLTDTVLKFKEQEKEREREVVEIDLDALTLKLKSALLPEIEKMVKEYCRENATKVAWEVIPDLAENLIKKELKEISDSVH